MSDIYSDPEGNIVDRHHSIIFAEICAEDEALRRLLLHKKIYRDKLESFNDYNEGKIRSYALDHYGNKYNETVANISVRMEELWNDYCEAEIITQHVVRTLST